MITIASDILESLLGEASRAHPHECCGIMLGRDGRIDAIQPAINVHPDPATHFEVDPRALVDAHRAERGGGPAIAGFYHSHPNGLAEPSATDRAAASGQGKVWAIVAAGDVTFWRDGEDGFSPLSYSVRDA